MDTNIEKVEDIDFPYYKGKLLTHFEKSMLATKLQLIKPDINLHDSDKFIEYVDFLIHKRL